MLSIGYGLCDAVAANAEVIQTSLGGSLRYSNLVDVALTLWFTFENEESLLPALRVGFNKVRCDVVVQLRLTTLKFEVSLGEDLRNIRSVFGAQAPTFSVVRWRAVVCFLRLAETRTVTAFGRRTRLAVGLVSSPAKGLSNSIPNTSAN